MLLLPALPLHILLVVVCSIKQYSSHAPTHGTASLFDISVYREVVCILYERSSVPGSVS